MTATGGGNHYRFREILIADLRVSSIPAANSDGFFRILKHVVYALIMSHNFSCVFHFRLNHALGKRFPRIAAYYGTRRFYMFGNDISYRAHIGPGFRIHHTSDIVIGRAVRAGKDFHIYNGVTLGSKSMDKPDSMPNIGDNVIIGTGAKVLGRVTIGDGVVIGALTFCDKDVPARVVAVGNPIRFLEKTAA